MVPVALMVLAVSAPAPSDPAALFPPGVLAYAEVRSSAQMADAVAALVKGTPLADSLSFSHDRRDVLPNPETFPLFQAVQSLGLLTSPEMLAELKRTAGVSAALLGFDEKSGRPRYAIAIRLGESHALGLLVRAYLTTGTAVRRVGKIGDVPVYQNRPITGGRNELEVDGDVVELSKKKHEPNIPPEGADEPTYLYVPGLFVVGSGKAAVADVLERFRTEKAESFAGTLGKLAEVRAKPGVFAWADLARMEKEYAAARKRSGEDLIPTGLFAHLRLLLQPKTLAPAAGTFSIEPDGFTFTVQADTTEAGPLVALLNGGTADAKTLRAEAKAWCGFTVALPKENRRKAVVRIADALAAAGGDIGQTPGERLADLAKAGFKADDLFPTLRSVAAFPPDASGVPLLLLTLDSVDAAKAWEAAAPRFAQWLAGCEKAPDPASEVVNELKVFGVVIEHEGGRKAVFYCRNGDQIAVGFDRARVVAASALDPAAKPPAKPTKGEAPAAFGFVRLDPLARWAGGSLEPFKPTDRYRSEDRIEELVKPGSEKQDDPPKKEEAKPDTPAEALRKALADVPPITFDAAVSGKTLTVAVRWRCEKKPLAGFIAAWMAWAESPHAAELNPPEKEKRTEERVPKEINPGSEKR